MNRLIEFLQEELAFFGAVLDLVAATQPGPFGPRTIEMGEYTSVWSRTGACWRWRVSACTRAACVRSAGSAPIRLFRGAAWRGA